MGELADLACIMTVKELLVEELAAIVQHSFLFSAGSFRAILDLCRQGFDLAEHFGFSFDSFARSEFRICECRITSGGIRFLKMLIPPRKPIGQTAGATGIGFSTPMRRGVTQTGSRVRHRLLRRTTAAVVALGDYGTVCLSSLVSGSQFGLPFPQKIRNCPDLCSLSDVEKLHSRTPPSIRRMQHRLPDRALLRER